MEIIKTTDPQFKPSVVMMVYGEGGVGKTTFASTAPKPLLADCENGSKYFGLRGITLDVAPIKQWSDMRDIIDITKSDSYETLIIDPIGELMQMLKRHMVALKDSKLVQKDGSPTMAGWGWIKKTMRDYITVLKNSGKHVILVAHVDEKNDEQRMVKRPKIETGLSDELVNMVDIVAYMTVITDEGEEKRVLYIDPTSDKFTAKDRTGQLGKYIEPDFKKIVNACQGNEVYSWSSEEAKKINKENKEKDEIKDEAVKEKAEEEAKTEAPNETKPLTNPHLAAARAKVNGGQDGK